MRIVHILPESMIYVKRTRMYVKRFALNMPEGKPAKGMETRSARAEMIRIADYCGNRTLDMVQSVTFEPYKPNDNTPQAIQDLNKVQVTYTRQFTLNRSQFPNQHCPTGLKAIRDENGTYRRHNLPDKSIQEKWNNKLLGINQPGNKRTDIITTIIQGEYIFTLKNGKPIKATKR